MESKILKIIVKQWFRDKAGIKIDNPVLDKVINELTKDSKENTFKENTEVKSIKKQINDLLFLMQSGKNCIGETSNQLEYLFTYARDKEPQACQGIHYESKKDAEANKESDWISVKDKMPEENACKISKDILTFNYGGECNVGYTCNGIFKRFNNYDTINIENITHWRHLPEPPKNN